MADGPTKALGREEAKRLIVGLMVSGELLPDSPVSERSLAERLNLGRTPVREALHDLRRDGLIGIEPTRGSHVRRLGLDDLREIFEVRYALEALAAAMAATRGPTARLCELHNAFSDFSGDTLDDDEAAYYRRIGHELHSEIVAAARNTLLSRQYEQVRLMIEISLSLTRDQEASRVRSTISEHLAISSAILARDPVAAQTAMQAHLREGHLTRMRILTEMPPFSLAEPFAVATQTAARPPN
ncbi:MAG: GntR family transcriptional regulator [Pseudomonadota bacterium]